MPRATSKAAAASTPTAPSSALTSELTQDDLARLQAPFPPDRLGVKVQSFSRERNRAMLVLFLNHIDVQARLEEVDPAWSSEILWEERAGDTVFMRMRLLVKGVARENVGEGNDPKSAASDALKRAAMLFGIGRYLYDSPTVWVDYDDSKDRFRQWAIHDYVRGLDRAGLPHPDWMAGMGIEPAESAAAAAGPATAPAATGPRGVRGAKPGLRTQVAGPRAREDLNRRLMNLYRPYLAQFPQTQFSELLQERYGVSESRLMTVEQLEDLLAFMEERMHASA